MEDSPNHTILVKVSNSLLGLQASRYCVIMEPIAYVDDVSKIFTKLSSQKKSLDYFG